VPLGIVHSVAGSVESQQLSKSSKICTTKFLPTMFFNIFPLFLLIPLAFNTKLIGGPIHRQHWGLEDKLRQLHQLSNKTGKEVLADYDFMDYQADGPRYPSDSGGVHVDPQFPVYSNWQRADDAGQFRINSPRKTENESNGRSDEDKKKQDNQYISVKLPEDVMQHFGKQYGIGNKDKFTNILGLPAGHIPPIGSDLDTPASARATTRPTTPASTSADLTGDRRDSHGSLADYQDHYRPQKNYAGKDGDSLTREHEYYNKQDLLPNLAKNNDNKDRQKSPSQDPVNSSKERSLWSVAWQAHIYFAGALFVLLALYCSINICRLHLFSRLFSRGYFLSLNLCMIIVGVSRGVFLLWDAYNESGSLYSPVAYILLNIGYPCITSAFSILFLALLRVTQVELLSPSVQTPRALGIFCCLHLAISIALDLTVGLVTKLQYLLLLGQGIFIVWSLLLSAGYFYIYSTMKKVVCRQQCELNRSVYPKLMYDHTGSGTYSMRLPPVHSNPLSRAVNLTLGVAVLGSLIGGVQLYGMIGMHGLLRSDPRDIPDPWYGYQVALRVLEILICYLLAVVATTPLRQDGGSSVARGGAGGGGPCSSCSPLLCCNGEGSCHKCMGVDNPPTHLDEEIYTEICSNNHSVRVLPATAATGGVVGDGFNQAAATAAIVGGGGYSQQQLLTTTIEGYNQVLNAVAVDGYNHHQAINTLNIAEQSQNPHCTATLALNTSGQQLTNTLARRRQQQQQQQQQPQQLAGPRSSQLSGDSSATMDTALYSNLRSRPSSMLFNDAGFVRFRLGNDPSLGQAEDLAIHEEGGGTGVGGGVGGSAELAASAAAEASSVKQPAVVAASANAGIRESIRGSRSFDEGILTEIKKNFADAKAPLERPQSNLSYSFSRDPADSRQIKSELCSPDVEGLPGLPQRPASKLTTHNVNRTNSPIYNRNESDTDVGEQYEAPAGLILPETTKSLAAQVRSVVGYSESDLSSLDPVYVAGKSIYGYSRAPSRCSSISATQSFDMRVYGRAGPSGSATLGRPKPKLENKFYYYGSTRGQKKSSQKEALTPRPLLPSQRTLGGDTRLTGLAGPSPQPAKVAVAANGPHSNPSQSLYDQIMGPREIPSPTSLAIQRSRSLGRDTPTHVPSNLPPRAPGPRTPTSVARKVLESVTKRKNKEKTRHGGRPGHHDPLLRQGLLGGVQGGAPGQLVQTADGRLVALGPGNTVVEVGTLQLDPRSSRARQISQDRDQMLYGGGAVVGGVGGGREFVAGNPNSRDIYGRLPYGGRLQGEVRQVVGTPPSSRLALSRDLSNKQNQALFHNQPHPIQHQQHPQAAIYSDQYGQPFMEDVYLPEVDEEDGGVDDVYRGYREQQQQQQQQLADEYNQQVASYDQFDGTEQRLTGDQQAARLAGNLASPPWRGSSRRREDESDPASSSRENTQQMGLESELDSEISSLFSYEQRDVKNLHLMSPLEYAAMLKQQYTEPTGPLGKDITPDSGVVVDSNNHSKERESREARSRRDNFVQGSRSSRNCGEQLDQLGEQLEQLGQQQDTTSCSDESSSEREDNSPSVRKPYTQVPQSEPNTVNGTVDTEDPTRQRKSSVQSNMTDSDPVSYEFSADSLLSDSDKESTVGGADPPVLEKLSSVCNEIKAARFLQE